MYLLHKENKRNKMLFFADIQNLPFKFMYLFKDSFIHIDNSSDLLPTFVQKYGSSK